MSLIFLRRSLDLRFAYRSGLARPGGFSCISNTVHVKLFSKSLVGEQDSDYLVFWEPKVGSRREVR